MKLDAKSVAGLILPEGKDEIVQWDDELPKFGLRLRRGGGRIIKTWVVQYRVKGKTQKATFGDARVVSPSQARTAARKHLAEVALGADPQAERTAKRQAAKLTFAKVVEAYLKDCEPRFRRGSFKKAKLYLTRPCYFHSLHAKAISEIAFTDVTVCVRDIEHNRSAIAAHCARNILSTFFSWVVSEGLLGKNPVNPVIGTRVPQGSTPRDRVLSDDELIAFWRATESDWRDSDERSGSTPHRYRDLPRHRYRDRWGDFCGVLRLLLLLGARRNEIAEMPWSELDLATRTWTLPSERSKNKRPLTLILPKAAIDILAAQPRRPGDLYVFGPQPGRLLIDGRLMYAFDHRLGVTPPTVTVAREGVQNSEAPKNERLPIARAMAALAANPTLTTRQLAAAAKVSMGTANTARQTGGAKPLGPLTGPRTTSDAPQQPVWATSAFRRTLSKPR